MAPRTVGSADKVFDLSTSLRLRTRTWRRTKPEYEDSFGHCQLRYDNEYNFWHAQGRAEEDWNTVGRQIAELLESRKSELPQLNYLVLPFMVGTDYRHAHPHAVIFCSNITFLTRARALILESEVLETAGWGRACIKFHGGLQQPASTSAPTAPDNIEPSDGAPVYYASKPVAGPHGAAIKTKPGTQWRRATLGGVIQVGNKYYGLTVAHVFEEEPEQDVEGTSLNLLFDSTDLDVFDSTYDDRNDSLMSRTSLSSLDVAEPMAISTSQWKSLTGNEGRSADQSDDAVSRKLGSLAVLSNDPVLTAPSGSSDSDWALVTLDNAQYHQNNEAHFIHRRERITQVAKQMPSERGPVSVRSGSNHNTSGMSIRAAGFIHISGCRGVLRVWRINLKDIRLGDCGSWAIDERTGELLGMLIASCDALQEAYLLPAIDVFQDIAQKTGMIAMLPQGNEAGALSVPISADTLRPPPPSTAGATQKDQTRVLTQESGMQSYRSEGESTGAPGSRTMSGVRFTEQYSGRSSTGSAIAQDASEPFPQTRYPTARLERRIVPAPSQDKPLLDKPTVTTDKPSKLARSRDPLQPSPELKSRVQEKNSTGNLKELKELSDPKPEVEFVLVPGIGTPRPEDWDLVGRKWQDTLTRFRVGLRFWTFDHGIQSISQKDRAGWAGILTAATGLATQLKELYNRNPAAPNPVVIICHSLGGLIVKEALNQLNPYSRRADDRADVYFRCVVGILFASTPHGSVHQRDQQEIRSSFHHTCQAIIKQCTNTKRSPFQRLKSSSESIFFEDAWLISRRFDEIKDEIQILSVFEISPTAGPRRERRTPPLVSYNVAAIGGDKEELMASASDHTNTCNLAGAEDISNFQAVRWLESAVKDARYRLEKHLRILRRSDSFQQTPYTMSRRTPEDFPTISSPDALDSQPDLTANILGQDTIVDDHPSGMAQARQDLYMIEHLARNTQFFDRRKILSDMERVLSRTNTDMLSETAEEIDSLVLLGPAGYGKTEITVEFVLRFRQIFDAIFWVRAEDKVKLDLDFRRIAVRLGLQGPKQAQDPVTTRGLVHQWLSNPRRIAMVGENRFTDIQVRWLLVLDNADDAELLHDYIPARGSGAILITSRDPGARHVIRPPRRSKTIAVNKFDSEEGLAFLKHQSRIPTETSRSLAACQQIVSSYDGHPLALTQIAGFMRYSYISYSELHNYMNDDTEKQELLKQTAGIGALARGSVPELVAISMSKLPPDAKELLRILCFLDPDRIPESIFDNYRERRSQYHAARAPLLQCSLLRRNEDKGTLWMHRVDQEAVKNTLTPEERSIIIGRAIGLVRKAWPSEEIRQRQNHQRWPKCEKLYPHAIILLSTYEQNVEPWPRAIHADVAKLLQEVSWWQHERGDQTMVISQTQRAERICQQELAGDDWHRIDLMSSTYDLLSCYANATNDARESKINSEKFLELRQQIATKNGCNDGYLAYAYNQLGIAFTMENNYLKAMELFKMAVEIWHSLPTYEPGIASMEYANLGLALLELGDVKEASRNLEEGLRERETRYGKDDVESFKPGRILYALGNVRAAQQRFPESEEYHRRALITFRNTVGIKHHRTADVSHKIAEHCLRKAKDAEDPVLTTGIELVNEALENWRHRDDKIYTPEITRTSFLKSKLLRRTGQISDADAIMEGVHQQYQRLVETAKSKEELASSDFDELVTFWSR